MNKKIENAHGIYLTGIRDGKPEAAMARHTGDRYTQHNADVKDGKEGFIEYFKAFAQRNPKRDIRMLRTLVDGNYVFCQVFQDLNEGDSQWVTYDFFLTDENDKVIEHWDALAEYSASSPSGHTAIDGPMEVSDLDKTKENKALVRHFIEHNASAPDGWEAFKRQAMAPHPPLNYEEIFLMVGQGNFVATFSKANRKDGDHVQDYAQADLFRIEKGKIVEHWGCTEPVLPKEQWVNSGKF